MFATESPSKGIDTNIAGNSETDDMGSVSTFTTIGNVSWGMKTSEMLNGTKRNGKVENGRSSVIGLACMIVFLGVVAGSALAYLGFRAEKNGRLDDFQRGAFVTVSKVEESFEDYVETASMIHGRFRHRPEFDGLAFASNTDTYIEEYMAWSKQFRSEFHETYQYVKATDLRFKAMQFTPYISSQERGLAENEIMDFLSKNYPEAAATYKGFRGFNGPNSTSLEPRWNQPFYFPIHYMEPIAGNEAAIDLDYYSSQSRMRAVDALFETKEPSMTDRLSLVKKEGTLSRCSSGDGDVAEGQGPSYGIVLMHPGHKLDSDDDTTWPKEFSAMVLCMSDLISRSNDHQSRPISMYIHDLSHPDSDKPVFMGAASLVKNQTAEESEIDDYNTILLNETDLDQVECRGDDSCYQRNITIANRIWTVTILDQHARNRSRMVYISLVGVIAFFAFLCLAIWVLNTDKRNRKYASIKAEAAAERNALVLENANRAAQTERELNDFLAHEVRNPLSAAMAATSFLRTELDRKSKRNKSDKGLRLHFDDTIDEKNSNEDEKEDYSVSLKDTDSTTMDRDSSAKSIGSFSSPRLVQAREDVRVVDHALHFINELLRNMLDMHRASSGKMLVKLAPVDLLRDVLEPVAGMLHRGGEGRIGRNGKGDEKVKIIVDCPEDIVVETDILRLKQVVLNLGRNSVKFINEGFIRLRAEVIEVECDHDHSRFSDDIESGNIKCKTVRIYVEDSGSGIPIEKRETLFAKYQESLDLLSQGTVSIARSITHTGSNEATSKSKIICSLSF